MKLAIVRQKYNPYGGAERFVERAVQAMKTQGMDVSIIAREWRGDAQGLRVDPVYVGRLWRDISFARSVQKIIASGRFDLVQSHERIPGCHIYRAGDGVHATWLEIRGKPLDRLSPWHRYILRAEEAMFRHPNLRAVICNSRMVRDDIAYRFGVPDEKLHVIYNGVDTTVFHPGLRARYRNELRTQFGVPDDRRVVLFVGSGFERKGLPTLLDAMVQVDAELWVVGRDKRQAAMERLAQKFRIMGRVRFFGGQEDVRPYYGAADVFALPTRYDPFPNALAEALASALPVVTTTACGGAEFLGRPATAVVPVDDPVRLQRALTVLLLENTGSNEVRKCPIPDLSIERMVSDLGVLYSSLGQCSKTL